MAQLIDFTIDFAVIIAGTALVCAFVALVLAALDRPDKR